mmetsp:Transcript_28671/g.65923  ORF Transcript_28671/g.65923 Transcript_28671/m.65923 type:complete len:90 (-) Transcript_28671:484-753(-)
MLTRTLHRFVGNLEEVEASNLEEVCNATAKAITEGVKRFVGQGQCAAVGDQSNAAIDGGSLSGTSVGGDSRRTTREGGCVAALLGWQRG